MSSVGISATIALAFLLGGAVPRFADAGALKCEDHFLDADDDMRLRAAALKVLPKSVHLGAVGACRNPNWAYGFIETKKTLTPEGVRQWYEFACYREAQPWKCEEPSFEQIIHTRISVDGASHPVELSFDRPTSLEQALILASRAVEVYADTTSQLPSCGASEPKESDLLRTRFNHSPLPAGENAIHVSVSGVKESVSLDDVDLDIEFRFNTSAGSIEAVCWWDVVIVT